MKANNSFILLSLLIVIGLPIAGCGTTSSQSDYLVDSYPYKSLSSCELLADVFQNPGDEAQPVLLWLHPGGTNYWQSFLVID